MDIAHFMIHDRLGTVAVTDSLNFLTKSHTRWFACSLQINAAENNITHHATLVEELAESTSAQNETVQPKKDHLCPGWRFLGNKWRWKQDWSAFDAKQRPRRLQEKAAEKSRRSSKRKKQQSIRANDKHIANKSNNMQVNKIHRVKESDKQLLASAKIQFAGPPSSTDHPIAALSTTNFINFKKGETINPYRAEKQSQYNKYIKTSSTENIAPPALLESNSTPGWSLDPMRPPIVSMTQQSADGDERFLKARLWDPKG